MQENLDRIINAANDTTNFYRFPSLLYLHLVAYNRRLLCTAFVILFRFRYVYVLFRYIIYPDFALISCLVNLLLPLVP